MFSPARQTLALAPILLAPMAWYSLNLREYHFDATKLLTYFSDIFNHPECAAQCSYFDDNDVPQQVCTTTIGYDDLYYTIPGTGKELNLSKKWALK